MGGRVDYAALFDAVPGPCLVLDPSLVVVEANLAYLTATGRTKEDLVGRDVFDALGGGPAGAQACGTHELDASLRRVLATCAPDTMALRAYDVPVGGRPGEYEERWWSPVSIPVPAADGSVAWIVHHVEDVTGYVRAYRAMNPAAEPAARLASTHVLEAELYGGARELQRLNEELRRAHAREREVAVTLQQAMLHAPDLAHHRDIAVRYLPAVESLNVCGDWFDVVDIRPDRLTVAVGDVIGHGLQAAAVMGMLRSALSAAIRALELPGQALEVLGRYARSIDGALGTTAVKAIIDSGDRLITYSSAGHPPPVLCHADGSHDLLDQATDPPLGARIHPAPRPQASIAYRPGDILVLYTDGLIERRGEDIDTGLTRLTDAVADARRLPTEEIADAVLHRLGVAGGGPDDIAMVVVHL